MRSANRLLRGCGNALTQVADSHCLPFDDNAFQLSFAVESLCHTANHAALLEEVGRVTKANGTLVVFDAWRTDRSLHVDNRVKEALELTERSMAVGQATTQREWLQAAEQAGWRLAHHQALSREVMPNLQRFERMASRFLSRPGLASLIVKTVPGRLLQNAVAGYLMAQTVKDGLHTYDMLVLRAR